MEDFRSKLCLVDLAGSERAHDTGLTGVGLEEGQDIHIDFKCIYVLIIYSYCYYYIVLYVFIHIKLLFVLLYIVVIIVFVCLYNM